MRHDPVQLIRKDDEPVEVSEEGSWTTKQWQVLSLQSERGAAHASFDVWTSTQAVTEGVATLGSDVAGVVVRASV